MTRVAISSICPSRVTRADGAALRKVIEEHWADREPLELDFEHLPIASASFFDESLGVLAMRFALDELTRRVHAVNLTTPDRSLLNRIVARRSRERAS